MNPCLAPVNAVTPPELWPRFEPQFLEFNPSFVRLPDNRVIGFIRRDHYPPTPGRGMIWTLPLDTDLRPLGPPTALILDGEDPRVCLHGKDLLLFYVHFERDAQDAITGTSMMMAECELQGDGVGIKRIFPLPKAPLSGGPRPHEQQGWEKNWVPFAIDEVRLGLIYRQDPWEILVLHRDRERGVHHFEQAYSSEGLSWSWGGIRGGTPPIVYDEDHLLSFFHASEVVGSRKLYSVGAVLFERQAPFRPVQMTPSPLLFAPYKGGLHRNGWPVAASVIFPLGAERQGEGYRLLSGVDDGEVGIFTISERALVEGLRPLAACDRGVRLQGLTGPVQTLPAPAWRLPAGQAKLDDRALLRFLQVLCPTGRCVVDLGFQAGLLAACLGPHYREAHAIAMDPEEAALLPINACLNQLDHLITHPDFGAAGQALGADKADVDLLRVAGGELSCSLLEWARGMIEKSRPVILIQTGAMASSKAACSAWLMARNYDVEWAFSFCPQWALAIPSEMRSRFAWFI